MITKLFFIYCITLQTINGMHYVGADKNALCSIGRLGNIEKFNNRLKKTKLSPGALADIIEELRHMHIQNTNPMIALLHKNYKKSYQEKKRTLCA